jgi:hypothetical protein
MAFSDFTNKAQSGYETFRANTTSLGLGRGMAEFLRGLMPEGFNIRKLGPDGLMALKQELVAARPVFEAAGFDLAAVQLELTLSPRLLAFFHIRPGFNRENALAIKAEHPDSRIITTSLSALLRVAKWDAAMDEQDMPLQTITIDVSLAPGVHLSFQDAPKDGEDPDLF